MRSKPPANEAITMIAGISLCLQAGRHWRGATEAEHWAPRNAHKTSKQIMKTKTAIIITTLATFTVVLLGGCGTAGPGLPHQENVMFPFDVKEWKIGHQAENRSERVVE